ncbi:hypothetical protein [Hyunsoonleella rubra]|uniref:Nuclear transport factor 2 family protein n=1 Tax=Hyunsoonleella rubra TaxID=1737062 RepID=A0ABW5TAN5_9FLAO
MKKLVLLLCLCAFSLPSTSQNIFQKKKEVEEKFKIDSSKVKTLDKTIKGLYKVISGEKDAERNWKQFKFLFYPGAKLIPTGKNSEDIYKAKFMSPSEYIKSSDKWLKLNGFIEKEIHRKVNAYGNIAHVFSTYECYHSKDDEKPFMRGINSIQLLNDGKRWWIMNIYWSQETEDNPIPKAYLPRK